VHKNNRGEEHDEVKVTQPLQLKNKPIFREKIGNMKSLEIKVKKLSQSGTHVQHFFNLAVF